MNSLKRDLIERRLWPLAVVLVAAIVAVPFLLHGHRANAAIAPPPPSGTGAQTTTTATTSAHSVNPRVTRTPTSHTRNPFQAAATSHTHARASAAKTAGTTTTASAP